MSSLKIKTFQCETINGVEFDHINADPPTNFGNVVDIGCISGGSDAEYVELALTHLGDGYFQLNDTVPKYKYPLSHADPSHIIIICKIGNVNKVGLQIISPVKADSVLFQTAAAPDPTYTTFVLQIKIVKTVTTVRVDNVENQMPTAYYRLDDSNTVSPFNLTLGANNEVIAANALTTAATTIGHNNVISGRNLRTIGATNSVYGNDSTICGDNNTVMGGSRYSPGPGVETPSSMSTQQQTSYWGGPYNVYNISLPFQVFKCYYAFNGDNFSLNLDYSGADIINTRDITAPFYVTDEQHLEPFNNKFNKAYVQKLLDDYHLHNSLGSVVRYLALVGEGTIAEPSDERPTSGTIGAIIIIALPDLYASANAIIGDNNTLSNCANTSIIGSVHVACTDCTNTALFNVSSSCAIIGANNATLIGRGNFPTESEMSGVYIAGNLHTTGAVIRNVKTMSNNNVAIGENDHIIVGTSKNITVTSLPSAKVGRELIFVTTSYIPIGTGPDGVISLTFPQEIIGSMPQPDGKYLVTGESIRLISISSTKWCVA